MFHRDVLDMDLDQESDEIALRLREVVAKRLLRRGLVVALSGGIDSSVTCALAVRAFGPRRVFGLLLPERDSSGDSVRLATMLAEHLGIDYVTEDIQPTLAAIGCYRRQAEAMQRVFPDYGEGWKSKIVLPGDLLDSDRVNMYRLVVEDPDGNRFTERLPVQAYLEIVAATNFKQRIRKTLEYYHADRLNYAVAGTPNRLEYDQGFFVKNGDGSADVKPIAHLFKTQVYALARHLGLPDGSVALGEEPRYRRRGGGRGDGVERRADNPGLPRYRAQAGRHPALAAGAGAAERGAGDREGVTEGGDAPGIAVATCLGFTQRFGLTLLHPCELI